MLDLFESTQPSNMLPFDGGGFYHPNFLSPEESKSYLNILLETIDWRNDEIMMFGKKIITSRKVAWYADQPYRYIYSKTEKVALPWTKELMDLKSRVESHSGATFNSCLLNLYHNGSEGMGWHADDEKTLDPNSPIASVSLGSVRTFRFKHKTKDTKVSLELNSGSLLIMMPPTQEFWLHTLTKTTKIKTVRINLTFRTMLSQASD